MTESTLFSSVFLLTLLALGACWSCSSSRVDLEKQTKRLVMESGPCFGTCPEFTLTLFEKGLVTFDGKRHADRQGLHARYLSKSENERLDRQLEGMDFWSFQDVYRSQIPDLPTVTITYYEADGRKKSVRGKDGRPQAVEDLEELLRDIVRQGDWKKRKDQPAASALSEDVVQNELIVQLQGRVDPQQWIAKYQSQGMRISKKLSRDSPYFLVTFDPQAISPGEMLERVRQDPQVSGAQFNKRLSPRD